jgi:hypothetical protein
MKWALALALALVACSKKNPEGDNPASTQGSASGFSQAPPAPTSSAVMRAAEGGWSLHATAAQGCSDKKCMGPKCEPLCSRYVEERLGPFQTPSQKSRLYFVCFGSCLAGPPDGGTADAGH